MELLNLSNNHFSSSGTKFLRECYLSQSFTDVTLVTEDLQTIEAHRAVLSSASMFFKDFFNVIKKDNPIVYLSKIGYQQAERLLKFIYLGECQIPQEDVEEFVEHGKILRVHAICEEGETKRKEDTIKYETPTTSIKDISSELTPFPSKYELKFTPDKKDSNLTKNREETYGNKIAFSDENLYALATPNHESSFHCNHCDYKATMKHHLKTHIDSVHMGVKFPCDQCDYKASRADNLRRHERKTHGLCL